MRTGKFSPEVVERLAEIGQWMKVNGESIYGCGSAHIRSTFAWGAATSKPGHLYLHVYPEHYKRFGRGRPMLIPDLPNKVTGAKVLSTGAEVEYERKGDDVIVTVPEQLLTDPISTVIDLAIEGEVKPAKPRYITEFSLLPLAGNHNPLEAAKWTTITAREDGLVDLTGLPQIDKWSEALLAVDVVSDSAHRTELIFDHSDVGEVLLNGKRVFWMRGWEKKPVPDGKRAYIDLQEGRNRLVFRLAKGKTDGERGAWGIYCWIGGGKGLKFEPSKPTAFVGPSDWLMGCGGSDGRGPRTASCWKARPLGPICRLRPGTSTPRSARPRRPRTAA